MRAPQPVLALAYLNFGDRLPGKAPHPYTPSNGCLGCAATSSMLARLSFSKLALDYFLASPASLVSLSPGEGWQCLVVSTADLRVVWFLRLSRKEVLLGEMTRDVSLLGGVSQILASRWKTQESMSGAKCHVFWEGTVVLLGRGELQQFLQG